MKSKRRMTGELKMANGEYVISLIAIILYDIIISNTCCIRMPCFLNTFRSI